MAVDFVRRNLKEILLLCCVILALPVIFERLARLEGLTSIAFYLILLALMWGALAGAAYTPNPVLRWGVSVLFAASAYYFAVYGRVTTEFMTYDAFINMMNSAGFFGDALVQHRSAFLSELGPAALQLAAIGLKPRRTPKLSGLMLAAAPWFGTAVLTSILFARGGDGARALPQGFPPIAYFTLASYESLTGNIGPRQDVRLPLGTRSNRNVVLIVDESIAGQYLDINAAGGVPTPLGRLWPNVAIHNFGIAAAINNCSLGTNLTLRYGGTREAYQRINATMPSVWAYARHSGLQTVYIDAQRTGGALHNLMDDNERALIDKFIQFDNEPVLQRDMAAAEVLIDLLADPRPKFILVNKVGAHFPVHDKYPDSHMRYTPALPRGNYTNIADTGSREGFEGSPEDWRRYRNSYRNTLLWNVGTFFERILTNADLSKSTLVYTGDHGQDLHENGKPGLYTHCGPKPDAVEGAVPLVVIEGKSEQVEGWDQAAQLNRGRTSHYMIFPTLLRLMGYQAVDVRQTYGTSLLEVSNVESTFNALFNARLNRQPEWIKIDPATLSMPPSSDHLSAPSTTAQPANMSATNDAIAPN